MTKTGIPVNNDVRNRYDHLAESWDAAQGADSYNSYFRGQLQDHIKRLVERSEGRSLALELGAGTGAYLNVTAPIFDRVIATDISKRMLSVLENRAERLGLSNVIALQQDAYDLCAIESASVDLVYSVGLLETIMEFRRLFVEIHRVLKYNGTVVGITSNGSCPWYLVRKVIEGGERYCRTGRLATARNIGQVLQQVGFTGSKISCWGAVRPQMRGRHAIAALAVAEKLVMRTAAARYLGVLEFAARK
jgi:ubiquinone/menaquinone biosynthesis C-methylase UbiE